MDGRLERSVRTREKLIDAYLEVALRVQREPMASEVARVAKCSMRTLFERFGSLHALGLAAFDAFLQRRVSTPAEAWVGRGRAERIRFQVTVRARNCEAWLGLWRLVVRHEGESERIDQRLQGVRDLTRRRLELMYRPELESLPPARREARLVALEAVTDYAAWGRLREREGLSVEAATEVWIEIVDRLLPPTPGA